MRWTNEERFKTILAGAQEAAALAQEMLRRVDPDAAVSVALEPEHLGAGPIDRVIVLDWLAVRCRVLGVEEVHRSWMIPYIGQRAEGRSFVRNTVSDMERRMVDVEARLSYARLLIREFRQKDWNESTINDRPSGT